MIQKYLVSAVLIAAFAAPAVAATAKATTYYAEQSVKSQRCYAVTVKPNGKTVTMIGTDSFTSLSKAVAAIKADASCKGTAKMAAVKVKAKTPAPAPAATPAPAPAAKTK